jgi:hypothetical protein
MSVSTGLYPTLDLWNVNKITITITDRLKYAEVKPLFKNGDKTDPSKSLLTSFCKIFEKIIYRRI